jgi:hypothetical protein
MAVRDDFAPGEVLAAADLNDTFASKLPYSYGTATPTTTDSGFLWYDSNSTPAATKFWDGSAFVPFGGKILQIVRATDTTERSTTSNTLVDASMSVTITPQKSDSAIIVLANVLLAINQSTNNDATGFIRITDNSNNLLSGAEDGNHGVLGGTRSATLSWRTSMILIGYSTPATTSATTYKLRFVASPNATVILRNSLSTGQIYAIEVSA